jgi:NAD(P)-dependent dehydrogenase (short-subunit alcohol dehydrogenase family)
MSTNQLADTRTCLSAPGSLGPGAVVITGGSRGIGAELARSAARAGAPVAILYRARADAAGAVVADITAAGGRAVAIAADVTDEAQLARAFDAIDRELGRIAALVNCAVEAGPPGRFTELDAADLERVVRTNLIGAALCCREAARRMSTVRGGHGGAIVLLSSAVAVRTGAPGTWVHFAAAKAAIETLSRGLARELASEGIRVNVVRPGMILTETRLTQSAEYRARLLAQVPMARLGEPGEVAAAVLWLLSPAASYVTGAELEVSGGL